MAARWARKIVVILVLVVSLYGGAYGRHVPGTSAASKPCAGRHDVAFAGKTDAATQQAVLAVACATSTVRGLVAHTPVAVRLVDAATMSATVKALMARDTVTQALAQSETTLQMIGAITSTNALSSVAGSTYNPDAVAQYDPYHKTLYVQATRGHFTPLDLAVISHEYVRALQDQYFDMATLLSAGESGMSRNIDQQLAREAVAEGDAVTTMLSYAAASFDAQQKLQFTQQLQRTQPSTSDFLHDIVGFPAALGFTFVSALRNGAAKGKQGSAAQQAAGNNAVNQALRNLPTSTAEILDPTRYQQHSAGSAVPAPTVSLGAGWTAVGSDVLGAYGIDDLLQEHATDHSPTVQAADQAAAGWQSDRWVLYQHAKQSLITWHLRFTSTGAANSFIRALADYTGARFHATVKAQPQIDWGTGGYVLCVRQRGSEVAVAMASDKSMLPQCAQALKALGFA
jgi:hypothetical protein